jgi:hypothetical protein
VSERALTELADRLAIQDLIARYPIAVDGREWDALDDLFAPDARIDFTAFGGPAGDLASIKVFLREALGGFKRTQHMMGLPAITLSGDRASARTSCNNPMVMDGANGETSVWLIGLWYDDEFVRTSGGWRFASRKQERNYFITGLKDAPA